MIGLMWCQGSNEEKAEMFFNITKPMTSNDKTDVKFIISVMMQDESRGTLSDQISSITGQIGVNKLLESANIKKTEEEIQETRVWSNQNFRYIFDRLFKFSIDMPKDLWDEFADCDLCDAENFRNAKNKLVLDGDFYDYDHWTHKA